MWIMFFIGLVLAILSGQALNTNVINWRSVETIIVLTGATGIVATIAEARRIIPRNEIEYCKRRLYNSSNTLKKVAISYLKVVDFRIESNSSNLDQYTSTRPWIEKISDFFNSTSDFESVKFSAPKFPEEIDDKEILQFKLSLENLIDNYENSYNEFINRDNKLSRNSLEELVLYFSPFLLSVAISLSLFKALYQ